MTIPLTELRHLLRSKAILLPGVHVDLQNEKTNETETWHYENGLRGYLSQELELTTGEEIVIPLFEGELYADHDNEGFASGEGAAWVVAWTTEGPLIRESFVNLIPTTAGGTHESGLRDGLFNARQEFYRNPFTFAERRQVAARRRLRPGLFRPFRQSARSPVSGPDQGTAEFTRRSQTGFAFRQTRF